MSRRRLFSVGRLVDSDSEDGMASLQVPEGVKRLGAGLEAPSPAYAKWLYWKYIPGRLVCRRCGEDESENIKISPSVLQNHLKTKITLYLRCRTCNHTWGRGVTIGANGKPLRPELIGRRMDR